MTSTLMEKKHKGGPERKEQTKEGDAGGVFFHLQCKLHKGTQVVVNNNNIKKRNFACTRRTMRVNKQQ